MRKLNLKKSVVYAKDASIAVQLGAAHIIGETCLFSDDREFNNYYQATLARVDIGDTVYPYGADDTLQDEYFAYMIPITHAVFTDTEVKPKLRMLKSFNEFIKLTDKGIGDIITIRSTDPEFDFKATCMVLGTATRNETEEVLIGNYSIDFEELLDEYEWGSDHGTFRPFGIEE